jgi:hypothetical protein
MAILVVTWTTGRIGTWMSADPGIYPDGQRRRKIIIKWPSLSSPGRREGSALECADPGIYPDGHRRRQAGKRIIKWPSSSSPGRQGSRQGVKERGG